ncbi:MAG: L,D-transpeptidase [Starkeya sp.]|nr:L,D-transpeptidase [Starkeya sp.]
MPALHRRAILALCVASAAVALGGCKRTPAAGTTLSSVSANPTAMLSDRYGAVADKFPIAAVDISQIDPTYLRREVVYQSPYPVGTVVIDPAAHFLYLIQPGGTAMRYGVGVGKEGFGWSGVATINSKQEWPDWYPPKEMIQRRPDIQAQLTKLQGGDGVPGGLSNPLGARAMYLWQDGKDTLYRIHGTLEPETIGTNVSSGCIRMINQDAIDLYGRVGVGTKVVVLGSKPAS